MAPIPLLSVIGDLLPRMSKSLALSEILPTTITSSLEKRQTIVVVPATYPGLSAGPPPSEVVGIVLGTVGGILLILWLIYTCMNMSGTSGVTTSERIVREAPSSSRRRSVSRSEVIEVRSPPRRREERRETTIIREDRRPVSREDDIVEVIEEHSLSRSPSPPRRQRSTRESGYRNVDPEVFAGGGRPLRKVSRR